VKSPTGHFKLLINRTFQSAHDTRPVLHGAAGNRTSPKVSNLPPLSGHWTTELMAKSQQDVFYGSTNQRSTGPGSPRLRAARNSVIICPGWRSYRRAGPGVTRRPRPNPDVKFEFGGEDRKPDFYLVPRSDRWRKKRGNLSRRAPPFLPQMATLLTQCPATDVIAYPAHWGVPGFSL